MSEVNETPCAACGKNVEQGECCHYEMYNVSHADSKDETESVKFFCGPLCVAFYARWITEEDFRAEWTAKAEEITASEPKEIEA